jgi:hypothetical protein
MYYMMSKRQYFGDKIGNAGDSHLMFWFPQREQMAWGAEGSDRSRSPNSRFRCPSGRTERPSSRISSEERDERHCSRKVHESE